MTALTPEALTTEEIVELALKQVAAFNSGDWEQLRAGLAPDSRYDEFGTQRKMTVRRRSSSSSRAGRRRSRMPSAR